MDKAAKARDKADPITLDDLKAFVNGESDFGFEMAVLKHLRSEGFTCSHSGSYQDPNTKKNRQFDIRARIERGSRHIFLAVECKNLKPNFPLLLSALERTDAEAFHYLLTASERVGMRLAQSTKVDSFRSIYLPGISVAKQTDQVGWNGKSFFGNDADTFDKMGQAINSADDMLQGLVTQDAMFTRLTTSVIIPIVVVPENTLFQVDYDLDGAITDGPRNVSRSALFFDRLCTVSVGLYQSECNYRISHLEFMTINALSGLADSLFNTAFPN